MTDTELTLAVTRWCEEKPTELPRLSKPLDGEVDVLRYQTSKKGFWASAWVGPAEGVQPGWLPAYNFATDRNACALFEALVASKPWNPTQEWSPRAKYAACLTTAVIFGSGRALLAGDREFLLATATARQRCKALAAMAGGDDE